MMTRAQTLLLSTAVSVLNTAIDKYKHSLRDGLRWYDEFWYAPCSTKDFVWDILNGYDELDLLYLRDWDFEAAREHIEELLITLADCSPEAAHTLAGYVD